MMEVGYERSWPADAGHCTSRAMMLSRRPRDASHVNVGPASVAHTFGRDSDQHAAHPVFEPLSTMTNVVEAGTAAVVQPTETTALLPARQPPAVPEHPPLPLVEPVILRVLSKGIASCTDSDLCPTQLNSRAEEIAFSLIVLLYARSNASYRKRSPQDVLERWHAEQQRVQDLESLDQRVTHIWNTLLSQCHSDDEIEVALWTNFPYEKPGCYSKRGMYL